MPRGPFDLIVVSEIAYYLSFHEMALLGKRLLPLLRLAVKLSCFTTADTFKMLRHCPVSRTFDCDLSSAASQSPIFEERYPRFDVVALSETA